MVHYQSSRGKQYSGDSLLQRTGFYSNKSTWHSHMDPNVLSSSIPASQELMQAFPKPRSPCHVFLHDKGSPAELRGILTADINCRLISGQLATPGHQEKGQHCRVAAASAWELGTGSDIAISSVREASDEW
jgi:hypothetical protein